MKLGHRKHKLSPLMAPVILYHHCIWCIVMYCVCNVGVICSDNFGGNYWSIIRGLRHHHLCWSHVALQVRYVIPSVQSVVTA